MSDDLGERRRRRFRRIDELFSALDALPPAQREARLRQLEATDPDLFPDLRELLEESASTLIRGLDDLAERPGRPSSDSRSSGRAEPGLQIGPYRLVRELGVGGMGEVWEARQDEPIRRRVALKILRSDKSNPGLEARFRSEQQALAMMDHPNIASAYEAGTTEAGEPWFAMELIEGVPITRYCDVQRLGLDQRLDLFCTLCDAVQHAHRRGVVHRDLKPANVLVSSDSEGDGTAPRTARLKVIDFGIAKALDQDLLGEGQTLAGDFVGTPEYMSPEQAGYDDCVVDTRTDVYALGVLLFELLAGDLPIPAAVLRAAGLEEMRRTIREFEPPKPSSLLAKTDDAHTTEVARKRASEAGTLARRIRGDLDWIVLKALSKSKPKRYETPSALADDVLRFRSRDPVLAGPPTWSYRAGKWIRKHRAAALIVATILSLLGAGVVSVTAALLRARAAERALAVEVEQERATRRFLVELFETADPFAVDPWRPTEVGSELGAAEMLERGAARLLDESIADPVTRARLQLTVGRLQATLANHDDAENLLRAALATVGDGGSGGEELWAEILLALGEVSMTEGEIDSALGLFEESLERTPADGGLLRARVLTARANALRALARHDEALSDARGALVVARGLGSSEVPASERRDVLHGALGTLADVYVARGDSDAAVETLHSLVEAQERAYGPDHPRLSPTIRSLANALDRAGDYNGGAQASERALSISRSALGDVHPIVAYDLSQVAASHRVRGQYAEALSLLQEADEVLRQTSGYTTARAITQAEIGMCLEELGRAQEAILAHRASLTLYESAYGPDHPELASALSRLSSALRAAGQVDDAVPLARRALRLVEATHPEGHWQVVVAGAEIAQAMLDAGDPAEALMHARVTSARARQVLGPEHVMYGAVQTIEATALIAVARRTGSDDLLGEAEVAIATARSIFEEQQGPQSPNLAYVEQLETDLAAARR